MEKHTYSDSLRVKKETTSRELFEEIERPSTLGSDVDYPDPNTPHAGIRPQTEGRDEPGVTVKEILAGEAIEAASEDPSPPSLPTNRVSSPEELYYIHQILELYRRSMKTIHAWLVWEGYGSPGNVAQPTSRLLELAERARRRDARPSPRELWALEVAIDCAEIVQKVEEGGEGGKKKQFISKTSAVAV